MPQVSIIIPTCNRAELLPQAIRSVLDQSFHDFELLVVDDGGDHSAAEIVKSFSDPRIDFMRHQHRRGGAAARNTGIARARGEYVAFLDDDDEWFSEKLDRQCSVMKNAAPRVGAVYTGYTMVETSTRRICGQKKPSHRGDLSNVLLSENCIGGTSSVMVRRTALENAGVFDESLPSFQDYDLWIRLSKQFDFDYVAEPLLKYAIHQNKIWTDLEALRQGIEMMVKKHGNARSLRRFLSFQLLSLGVSYCRRGDLAQARKAYLGAIRLNPSEIRHYVNLGLSWLGAKNFGRIKQSFIWRALSDSAK